MIQNLEEENIIMKYRWQLYNHGYANASRFTWIVIKTKREKAEKEEEHINQEKYKDVTFDCCL